MSEQLTAEEIRKIRQMLENLQRAMIIDPVMIRILQSEAIGARVYRSTAQSIPNTTLTALSWDTEVHDTADCWDIAQPTRLVAPFDGYYMAGGSIELGASQVTAAARLFITVRINGTDYKGANENHTISGKAAVAGVATGMFWMNEGDYAEIIVYHDIGAAKNVTAATPTFHHINNGWLARIA